MKNFRPILYLLTSFTTGIIFAVGLYISGMTNPINVYNFLDVTGDFDPKLIFVMIGAIGINIIIFPFIFKKKHPVLTKKFYISTRSEITIPLIGGSILFGIGWGIAGLCPGPVNVSLTRGINDIYIFFISMLSGGLLFQFKDLRKRHD